MPISKRPTGTSASRRFESAVTALLRWLRTRSAFVVLVAAWLVVLGAARLGAWDAAPVVVVALVVVLGVLSVIAFMQRWGETQDSVVERDFYRARLAEEAERILDEEEKQASKDGKPPPKQ